MKNIHNRLFMFFFLVVSILLVGMVSENILSLRTPATLEVDIITKKVDVSKVKAEIEKADLKPHDAKYWKIIGTVE